MDRSPKPLLGFVPVLSVVALVAAACGTSASAGSDGPSMQIASPKDGASVSEPFMLSIDSDVALGDPSTGDHHVHLCFDGGSCDSEYTLVYADTFTISDLPPGEHTIEASLRNADHSAAGPTDSITVTVTGGASSSAGTGTTGDAGRGYGS